MYWAIKMSLKSIFKDICKELDNVEHTSEKFVGVNDDWERFSMAYDVCRGYFERLKLKCTCKCNQRSATCRKEGNELFKNYSYWKALVLYNESIAFASNDSDELGFAYGNRASCLLRLHYPNEALQDIEKALSLCVSCTFKEKLLARKKQCLSEIKNLNHAQSRASFGSGLVPPLGRGKSLFFDSVSDVVELSHDEFWERKLIVNDNIRVGEVLIVEKPYSSVVLPDHFYTHCSKCFQRSLNLLPCSACSTTMFCSEECMSTANHVIECSYLEILSRLNAKGRELLSLKILIDASNQGKQLEKLYTEITKYNCGKNNGNCQFYSSMDFINIYNLVTNSDKRNTADLFYRSVISGVLILILEKCTNFFNSVAENRKEILKVFSGGLVLRFMQSLPCNAHEISEYYCANLIEVGAGAYATLSLINHSCDPNVVRYCCKNEIILRAIKPINRGEQIFDNYGYHYATHNLQERQNALLQQYYFKCQCEACEYNWPTFTALTEVPLRTIGDIDMILYDKLTKEFEEDMDSVLKGNHNDAIIKKNMSYLDFLHKVVQRPWINYNKCQELIKHCLNFYSNYFILLTDN